MKILLFGKNGQVGWELQRSLAPLGELIALGREAQEAYCGDFTRLADVAKTIRAIKPHVIINAAAYTAVDRAESEAALAYQINAEAPQMLAEEAAKLGSLLIHYSTDYVFNGQGTKPWHESDAPAPLNMYGQSKWQGEKAVATCPRHLILRTSWVYAARGANFVRTMLRLAKERSELQVVADQVGAPTSAELIADVTAQILHQVQHHADCAGLYHLTASGEASWHEFAVFALRQAQKLGLTLRVDPAQITPILTSAYPTPAARPHNSRLACTTLQQHFGLHLPAWQDGVRRVVQEMI